MIHRNWVFCNLYKYVVNCFQNPNFRDDSQGGLGQTGGHRGCELLSDPNFRDDSQVTSLRMNQYYVVNCFQNPNFRDDSQVSQDEGNDSFRCELLSES